jgi:N-[(2S)-2-amino-2-carboxyethyl]-L-glutamate dehydrogenase
MKDDEARVVKDQWVSAGQTILPCDLNTFWDPAISMRADAYIVDSVDEHKLFADMGYFPGGLPPITAETGAMLAGRAKGRTSPSQTIVNSNIGMAVCDVVVGRNLYERALTAEVGCRLKL